MQLSTIRLPPSAFSKAAGRSRSRSDPPCVNTVAGPRSKRTPEITNDRKPRVVAPDERGVALPNTPACSRHSRDSACRTAGHRDEVSMQTDPTSRLLPCYLLRPCTEYIRATWRITVQRPLQSSDGLGNRYGSMRTSAPRRPSTLSRLKTGTI
jgi:hypothetical protein